MMRISIRKFIRSAAAGTAILVGAALVGGGEAGFGQLATTANAAPGIRVLASVCAWDDVEWNEMTETEQRAWAALGWNKKRWESDNEAVYPASTSKYWGELEPYEQAAAWSLGYTPYSWDTDICP